MTEQRTRSEEFTSLPPRIAVEKTVAVHEQPGDPERLGWAVLGTLGVIAGGGTADGVGGCGDCD